ncbi:hypothetical protein BS17DRAFT_767609 [Gyrodon lividus]|nr:hypothetical protein BS17DRAFT_767609 [Gyrodon lividus]
MYMMPAVFNILSPELPHRVETFHMTFEPKFPGPLTIEIKPAVVEALIARPQNIPATIQQETTGTHSLRSSVITDHGIHGLLAYHGCEIHIATYGISWFWEVNVAKLHQVEEERVGAWLIDTREKAARGTSDPGGVFHGGRGGGGF